MTESSKGKRLVQYVADYTIFDLETTGISVDRDDIIEISAVRVKGGAVVDTFSTLVNPSRMIPYSATKVNGITDEMVADAPDIREAMTDFLAFIGDTVLIGHNIISFDLKFIDCAVIELFHQSVRNDFIDTLHMARTCLPELKHHRLVDVASYFHINTDGAHRALNDCVMNQKCYEELAKIQKNRPVMICPKCGGEMTKRNGKFGEFYGCGNYPDCRYTKKVL